MKSLKALIVEDHAPSALYLSNLILKHFPEIHLAGIAQSVKEGLTLIEEVQPELLFLDINLPPHTGFDLLKQVKNPSFEVIFCTAHDDYAIEAFKVAAFDYLLKPVELGILQDSVQRFLEKKQKTSSEFLHKKLEVVADVYAHKNNSLIISSVGSYEIVGFDEIVYIEAQGAYATFYLLNGNKITASKGLYYYVESLPPQHFFQCHKTFLINLDMIARFIKGEGGTLIMKNNAEVPVSLRKKEMLIGLLKDRLHI